MLDSDFSEAQICDQEGLSSATINYVYSQHHFNLLKASGNDPLNLTMANINYIKYIICMREVNNTTKAIKTLQNIINTPISPQTVCYQLKVRGMRLVIKEKGTTQTSLEEGKVGIC